MAGLLDASNHEWLKIVASTLTGLVAGILVEPLKSALGHQRDLSTMLRAVLSDFKALELQVRDDCVDEVLLGQRTVVIELPAFEYFWDKKRELFYETLETQILSALCKQVLLQGALSSKRTPREVVVGLRNTIREVKTLFLEISAAKRFGRWFTRKGRRMRGIQTSAWLQGKIQSARKRSS